MDDHRLILRQVGWVLIAVGLVDIGFMVYCIVNQISYASSFNIFSLVAGIFLLRGHLGAVRLVTWFSAFMFSGSVLALLVLLPWSQPSEYLLLLIRKNPLQYLISFAFAIALVAGVFWIYMRLRSPAVVAAREAAGQKADRPISAFAAGGALVIALAVIMHFTVNGEVARKAERLAEEQYGGNYKYFVSNIHWSGEHVSALLTAYNEHETKEVKVEWDD